MIPLMRHEFGGKFLRLFSQIKFVIAGLLNTAFGYGAYGFLIFINIDYQSALVISTIAGIIFNYFCFSRIVFNGLNRRAVFLKFIVAYILIYGVNVAILSILVNIVNMHPFIGQGLCIPICIILSWILMNYWVYKK